MAEPTGRKPEHGAHSPRKIRPVARAQRRAFLRRNGLQARDLDAIAFARLDAWATIRAKRVLIDRWLDEKAPGLVDPGGNVPGCMALYVSLANSERLALDKLEAHVQGRLGEPLALLEGEGRRVREEAERQLKAGES